MLHLHTQNHGNAYPAHGIKIDKINADSTNNFYDIEYIL